MHIFFRKPFFDTLTNCQKIFSHTYTLFVFFKIPQKNYKTGEKQAKKNLGPHFDATLDHILTQKNPNLGPHFDSTAYIYIYMLWGYYLVQVWPFWKLLSGPSLFFLKHRLPKNTIKIGVSALFFLKKNCAQKFWKLLSGPSWRFLRRSQLGPDNNFQLGPDNNFQKCHFFCNFLLRKMC